MTDTTDERVRALVHDMILGAYTDADPGYAYRYHLDHCRICGRVLTTIAGQKACDVHSTRGVHRG